LITRGKNKSRYPSLKISNKHLPSGKKFGVADDYPKEVDEIRRELYPVMKKAKRDHKAISSTLKSLSLTKLFTEGPKQKI